jgi:hypothetical protein
MGDLLPIPLAEVFTAAGAVVWAGALAGLVELLKRAVPFLPNQGRGVLYTLMVLAAALVGLAAYDLQPVLNGAAIVGAVLTWAAVVTAASGSFEVASKAGRIMQGTTDTTGPDDTPSPAR